MYHILKLSVTEKFTRYLDTTEITNYTLLESLLPSVITPITTNSRSDIHLSLEELDSYGLPWQQNKQTISILIRYETMETLKLQLKSISNQFNFSAQSIHIICTTTQDKSSIEQQMDSQYKVSINTNSNWIDHIEQETDFYVVLDRQVIPGNSYFNLILRLLNTNLFHHTLIGTEHSGNTCLQESQQVPELEDVFVLRPSWFLEIKKRDTLDISRTLYQTINVPSIVLPTTSKLILKGNTRKTCTSLKTGGTLIYTKSDLLDEMICKSTDKDLQVVSLDKIKLSCHHHHHIMVHHVANKLELDRLVNKVLPRVIIYEDNFENIHTNATQIALPTQDIPFVTSWITDLTVDTLEIVTIGGKRPYKVKQLFNQLNRAHYLGDRVDLSIVMDEKSDVQTINFVNKFIWKHGIKNIRHRIQKVHPMQTYSEAWYPGHDDEYAVMLDDRIELSSQFYIWLKYNVLKYGYQQQTSHIFGVSVYSPRIIDTDPSGRKLIDIQDKPYLMQAPTSFGGALYFPKHWKEFHDYITARLTDQATVKRGSGNPHLFKDSLLTVAKSNKWSSSWRKYFDEMIYMRGYVMVYPNQSYSTLNSITHDKLSKKKQDDYSIADKLYHVPLSNQVSELPDIDSLDVLDLHAKLTNTSLLVQRGHQLQSKFSACKPIIQHQHDPSDMLCPFNQLVQVPIGQKSVPTKTVQLFV
ncbi:hypothetical protein INT48_004914 [Thamnidium elegans]|uniref:Uncharacterized protein n=1 Tax=Thamnidium elegans TaxID=101142 RepID=A0A8H7SPS2_9FUNG|nr:hypothetical protein INT48_004914 [Thamnidium elegans]